MSELVAEGTGQPFGPGEKVFREWVLVDSTHEDRWVDLVHEARWFVNPKS
ncbi:MAG: hypothetical protein OSA99_10220 [Acidimicrobiales bacterium]|nr:hypothetical protein [Acidimicrobiales bacterium]